MMFTIETRINGALIDVIYGHNDGPVAMGDTCTYRIHRHEIETGKVESFEVEHKRSDGMRALVQNIQATSVLPDESETP